ncbi:MAG: hypothetical protein IT301_03155 [Dehalococcoidia bacterium]|nr:hypothetical protein [Dehalococcoidia bacterium]
MEIRLHPHASERILARGATEAEVLATVRTGERQAALHGRSVFRSTFDFNAVWAGKRYATKTIEAYAVDEDGWLVITVIVKFGGRMQ